MNRNWYITTWIFFCNSHLANISYLITPSNYNGMLGRATDSFLCNIGERSFIAFHTPARSGTGYFHLFAVLDQAPTRRLFGRAGLVGLFWLADIGNYNMRGNCHNCFNVALWPLKGQMHELPVWKYRLTRKNIFPQLSLHIFTIGDI